MMLKISTMIMTIVLAGCTAVKPYVAPNTVKEVQTEQMQLNRLSDITHNIFVSNSSLCTHKRFDYGLSVTSIANNANKKQKELLTKALHLKKQPTITHIVPNGVADKSGVQVGDTIISLNGTSWIDGKKQNVFVKRLDKAMQSPQLKLGILRGEKKLSLTLAADTSCDYSFILSRSDSYVASAKNRKIVVEMGMAKLLKQDDELAFVISHELAHILLGHTLTERKKQLDDYERRSEMEKDADALGIRLMIHAGYDPKGAKTALKKIDLIDSGPITKLLNYHGPYMSVNERIEFLRNVIGQ